MGKTNDGRKGGLLHGDAHSAPSGGMDAVVVTDKSRQIKLEGGEVIINKESVKEFWRELSRINQAGGGVPIHKPVGGVAKKGGTISQDSLTIQTILFDKKTFTEKEARAWLKKNNHSQQLEKGFSVWRARQEDPKKFDKKSFVSKQISKGVTFVFAKEKNSTTELSKGIKEEKEHSGTAKKLYARKIKPAQAPKSIAKEHLKENAKYYTTLSKAFKKK